MVTYSCRKCEMKSDEKTMLVHVVKAHLPVAEVPYFCLRCETHPRFRTAQAARSHVRANHQFSPMREVMGGTHEEFSLKKLAAYAKKDEDKASLLDQLMSLQTSVLKDILGRVTEPQPGTSRPKFRDFDAASVSGASSSGSSPQLTTDSEDEEPEKENEREREAEKVRKAAGMAEKEREREAERAKRDEAAKKKKEADKLKKDKEPEKKESKKVTESKKAKEPDNKKANSKEPEGRKEPESKSTVAEKVSEKKEEKEQKKNREAEEGHVDLNNNRMPTDNLAEAMTTLATSIDSINATFRSYVRLIMPPPSPRQPQYVRSAIVRPRSPARAPSHYKRQRYH